LGNINSSKSIIAKNVIIDIGSVVFAGEIIQPETNIGKHCIVNTNCNIDHESIISDFVSICPSSTICGQVIINESTFIGANSTIIQRIKIGNNCTVGAGTVVIRDIGNNKKVVGNPSRIIN
jgi:acetyltransferase EpsM